MKYLKNRDQVPQHLFDEVLNRELSCLSPNKSVQIPCVQFLHQDIDLGTFTSDELSVYKAGYVVQIG